jgi:predicted RNase H-like nuclease (RuvC/YqgF family)
MTEDTNTEVVETIEVETPTEETIVVDETTEFEGDAIEKAVALSEVEDTLDFAKMVNDLKSFFGESIEKNYSAQADTVQNISKMAEEAITEIKKTIDELVEKHETLNKTVTEMYGKIEYVDNRLNGYESATAVKKSSDLEGSMADKKIEKSIWQGSFLSTQSLTK